jgi:hypothetical protein
VQEHGCGRGTLFSAATQRAAEHPADAAPVYTDTVEVAINRRNRPATSTPGTCLLAELKHLHQRAGTGYLADLTTPAARPHCSPYLARAY